MKVVGAALRLSSDTESRGLRGRGSLVAVRKTRRRVKLKRGGSLEPSPPSLSSSTFPHTSKQG